VKPDVSFLARLGIVAGLFLIIGSLILHRRDHQEPVRSGTASPLENSQTRIPPLSAVNPGGPLAAIPVTAGQPAMAPPFQPPLNSPHPDAVAFGSAVFPPEREPEVLLGFFEVYRERFGQFPAGEDNPQMMNALLGSNPARLNIFPSNHHRLDAEGALLDAWGTPFFFHQISRELLEVRSAGPDLEWYTTDDLVTPTSGRNRAP
jgi:hypothetical protein